jgi:sn-glycerol 3-phosphate transport system substrate-binding protein
LAHEWREKSSQFKTADGQLHLAPNNRVTQGGLIGMFPTARQMIEGTIEEVLSGVATPKEALDKVTQVVTDALEPYHIPRA